jgi:ribulose-5-phosphate 4-epimerase/fuculose-1-phosphate aldolase
MEQGKYRLTAEAELVDNLASGNVAFRLGGGRLLVLKPGEFDFERLAPEEPPHNSVVIDNDGDAWQNNGGEWSMAGAHSEGSFFEQTWSHLTEHHGPVKVVHTP